MSEGPFIPGSRLSYRYKPTAAPPGFKKIWTTSLWSPPYSSFGLAPIPAAWVRNLKMLRTGHCARPLCFWKRSILPHQMHKRKFEIVRASCHHHRHEPCGHCKLSCEWKMPKRFMSRPPPWRFRGCSRKSAYGGSSCFTAGFRGPTTGRMSRCLEKCGSGVDTFPRLLPSFQRGFPCSARILHKPRPAEDRPL